MTAGALLLLGVLLRVLGYFGGIEFWWDEAMWVTFLDEGRVASIRPPGFVWVSRWLIDLRNTEPVIRAPSLVGGILSLPVFLAGCRAAGLSRRVSLFGLFVLAVHPAAIDLTKEFKPYALELFLHLLLLWLAFSFLRSPGVWRLTILGLAATAAAPFSWSVVVLYPGLFATTALSAVRRRHTPQALVALGGAMSAFAAALAGYLLHYRVRETKFEYWGHKYDIFYVGSGLRDAASWLVDKTYEVASFPAWLESFWLDTPAVALLVALQALICLVGAIAIITDRSWDRCGLWLSPWLVTIALNVLGLWPYGVFRTNLFLLAYALLVSLAGLDGVQRWLTVRPTAARLRAHFLVPVFCVTFVLVFLPLDLEFFAEGKSSGMAGNCYVHRAFEVVHNAERDEAPPEKPRRFLVDDHANDAYLYYRNLHAVAREAYRDFLRERYRRSRRYQPPKEAVDRQAERGFWLLACRPESAARIGEYALERCPQVDYLERFRHGGVLLRCRGRGERVPLDRGEHGDRVTEHGDR